MQLNWYSVVLLIGVVQGVFFALALWTKRDGNRQAHRFLAAFSLLFAVILTDELVEGMGLLDRYPHLLGLLWPAVFLIGPIFWWYVQSMIEGGIDFGRKNLLHLLPSLFSIVLLLPIISLNTALKRSFIQSTEIEAPFVLPLAAIALIFLGMASHIGYYIIKSLHRVYAYNRSLSDSYSYDEEINLRWLNSLTLIFFGVWVFFLIGEFLGGAIGNVLTTLVDLDMVVMLFVIGFFATRQVTVAQPIAVVDGEAQGGSDKVVSAETPAQKYQSSALSAEQATHIEQRLLTLMQTAKPYREGKLTLPQLASQLNTSPNYLSQIINERLERNFFDFVNQYRIEEAQQRLLSEPNRTILDIALDSGFNSKSAFYKVFKQQTGLTPSSYRKANVSRPTPEKS